MKGGGYAAASMLLYMALHHTNCIWCLRRGGGTLSFDCYMVSDRIVYTVLGVLLQRENMLPSKGCMLLRYVHGCFIISSKV